MGATGVTGAEDPDAPEVPPGPVAVAVKVYAVPFTKPVTWQLVAGVVTVHVAPPGEAATRYDVTGPPPGPAATDTVAAPLPASTKVTDGVVGADAPGVKGADVAAAPQPAPDRAETDTVYVVPLANGASVHVVVEAGTRHEVPPGEAIARYCVTAKDPALDGGVHDTVAELGPAATDTDDGAEGVTGVGGVGGVGDVGVTALDAADALEVPSPLDAVEVKVYDVPAVKPVTTHDVAGTVTVHEPPAGTEVTV